MSESILKVKSLEKSFKGDVFVKPKKVLHGVEFSVLKGKTTGFIGVNGAGKTTTIRCVLGFIHPDQGQVEFFNGLKWSEAVQSRLGFLPERPYFYDFLTGLEFLKFHWDLVPNKQFPNFLERAESVLKQVDLLHAKNSRLRTYSKGMLQRIGFAQSILHHPDLLILDEPMSGLDPDGRKIMKDIFKQVADSGTTIFFSSHLLQDMEELCDQLVILDQGRTCYEGSKQSFMQGQTSLEDAFYKLRQKTRGNA